MAIRVEKKRSLNAVEFISVNDDAVDAENSSVEEYKKTGDRSLLKFIENKQPTVFLLNFEFKGSEAEAIKNSLVRGKDEKGDPQVTLGSWSFRVAKYALKDIQNPPDLKPEDSLIMKKDSRGFADDELIALLDRFGIVDEISNLYGILTQTPARANSKN